MLPPQTARGISHNQFFWIQTEGKYTIHHTQGNVNKRAPHYSQMKGLFFSLRYKNLTEVCRGDFYTNTIINPLVLEPLLGLNRHIKTPSSINNQLKI